MKGKKGKKGNKERRTTRTIDGVSVTVVRDRNRFYIEWGWPRLDSQRMSAIFDSGLML